MSIFTNPFRWLASQLFGSKVKPYFDANVAPVINAALATPEQKLVTTVTNDVNKQLGPVTAPIVDQVLSTVSLQSVPVITAQSLPASSEAALQYVLNLPAVILAIDMTLSAVKVPSALQPFIREALNSLIENAVEAAYDKLSVYFKKK